MHGAPVSPREPPTTSTCPELNLVESSGPLCGGSSSTRPAIRPAPASTGAPAGIPISATRSSPVCHLPGAIQWPSFAEWKLTVVVAPTPTPSTSPVEAFTPDAMSAATTGAPQELIASIARSAGARGAPLKPVPKIASTTAPEQARAAAASSGETTRDGTCIRSRLAAASGDNSSAG